MKESRSTESRGDKIARTESRSTQSRGTKSRRHRISPLQNHAGPKISQVKISQSQNVAGTKSRCHKILRHKISQEENLAILGFFPLFEQIEKLLRCVGPENETRRDLQAARVGCHKKKDVTSGMHDNRMCGKRKFSLERKHSQMLN
jgi:hypothetical protein